MKAVTLLLVSGIIVLVFLGGCRKEVKDTVWNRDGLDKIVELEPYPDKDFPIVTTLEIEVEEEEDHWCAA